MPEKTLLNCLRLIRSPGIGCRTYLALVEETGSEAEALHFLSQKGRTLFPEKQALTEVKAHQKMGAHLLTYKNAAYPCALRNINDYPPVMSILGNVECLNNPMIAIVGSRQASLNAIKFTHTLSRHLSKAGYTIVSGLARGVDGAAHQGALEHCTVAVMAGGIDKLYPSEHKVLHDKILERGAIISEMPLGLFPGASHFPRRNRLISGLAKAVCVIEASKPSGSFITANYALDQGRELFAVPGFPKDPRSSGTNDLIRQGAYVLESADDVLRVIGFPDKKTPLPQEDRKMGRLAASLKDPSITSTAAQLEEKLLHFLSTEPLSSEELFSVIDAPERTLHDTLLTLELKGHIYRDSRGYIVRLF